MAYTPSLKNLKFDQSLLQDEQQSNNGDGFLSSLMNSMKDVNLAKYRPDNLVRNFDVGLMGAAQTLGRQAPQFGDLMPERLRTSNPNAPDSFLNQDVGKVMGLKPGMEVPFMQGVGKFAPLAFAPELGAEEATGFLGAKIPAFEQFAKQLAQKLPYPMAYGAGVTPEAPTTGALEAGAFPAIESGAQFSPEITQAMKQGVTSGINAFRPAQHGEQVIRSLGSGTLADNAESIAKDVYKGHKAAEAASLTKRQKVMGKVGDINLLDNPDKQIRDAVNPNSVAKVFGIDDQNFMPEQRYQLIQSMNQFKKDGDLNAFAESSKKILSPNEKLTPDHIDKLNEIMHKNAKNESQYFKNEDKYKSSLEGDLADRHDAYKENPTFNNNDELDKSYNIRIAQLTNLAKQKKLDAEGYRSLQQLSNAKSALEKDRNLILDKNPKLKQSFLGYKADWMNNVLPFRSHSTLSQMSAGKTAGFKPTTINSVFMHPTKEVKFITDKMGQATKNKILYNKLSTSDPAYIDEEIAKLMHQGGGQHYITPELERAAAGVKPKRMSKEVLNAATIGGISISHPAIGAPLAAYKYGLPAAVKMYAKYKGKS